MSAQQTTGFPYSIHFSGNCKHCGNATLIHIRELEIDTCAYCNQETTNHSEAAIYAPNTNNKLPQGEVSEAEINN